MSEYGWMGVERRGDEYAVEVDWAGELPVVVEQRLTVRDLGPGPNALPLVELVGPIDELASFLAEYHDEPRAAVDPRPSSFVDDETSVWRCARGDFSEVDRGPSSTDAAVDHEQDEGAGHRVSLSDER